MKWSNDRPPVLALSSPAEWSDSFANAEFVIPLDLQRRLPAATAEKKTRAVMNLAVLRQYTETRCSLAQIDELISSLKKTISSTNPPVTPAGKVSVGVRLELFRAEDPRTFLLRNRKRARVEIQVYQIP